MTRWIELDGTHNTRDLAGLPLSTGGEVRPDRLLRSDNLQDLTDADVRLLVEDHGLTDVLDLRTRAERDYEGPTRLDADERVRVQHLSLLPESLDKVRHLDGEAIMPWSRNAGDTDDGQTATRYRETADAGYRGYLDARADSILTALRTVAHADGAVLVHCAAGKDRTGVVVAIALDLVGVPRDDILQDFLITGQRVSRIVEQLRSRPAYSRGLRGRSIDSHMPDPGAMTSVFAQLDAAGGSLEWVTGLGWSRADQDAIGARLTG